MVSVPQRDIVENNDRPTKNEPCEESVEESRQKSSMFCSYRNRNHGVFDTFKAKTREETNVAVMRLGTKYFRESLIMAEGRMS